MISKEPHDRSFDLDEEAGIQISEAILLQTLRVASLVALGYLPQAKRHHASSMQRAIEPLRLDLFYAGVI